MTLEELIKEIQSVETQCQEGKPDIWDVLYLLKELIEILQNERK